MELRQLRYFTKVAELGSFSKAAVVLDVAQPALSRVIRDLELELGVSLLLRTGRGAVLTDAGIKLLARGKMLLDDAERAFQEVSALKGRPMGLVSIGMTPSIGTVLTVPLVERVRRSYPDVQLQLTEGYSGHLQEWLLSGRLDLGILYSATRAVGTSCDQLTNEQLYLLGAPDIVKRHLGSATTVEFAAIPRLPLIMPARPHAIRKLIDETAAKHHIEIHLGLEANAFVAIRDLVAEGHGLTILPISPVLALVRAGRIRALRIVDPELFQVAGLMTSTHHPTTLATKTLVGVVQEVARELVASGDWPERYEADRRTPPKPLAASRMHTGR
jgi:LysR family nitrogen assimilation transcriptional regulator